MGGELTCAGCYCDIGKVIFNIVGMWVNDIQIDKNYCWRELASKGPLWQYILLCPLFQLLLKVLAVKDSHLGEYVGGDPFIGCYCDRQMIRSIVGMWVDEIHI